MHVYTHAVTAVQDNSLFDNIHKDSKSYYEITDKPT